MGCGSSKSGAPAASEEEREAHSKIQKAIKADAKALETTVKLLMLGPGDSGKSTLVKQFKVLFLSGYSEDERLAFRSTVRFNAMDGMRQYTAGAQRLGVKLPDSVQTLAEFFMGLSTDEEWTDEVADDAQTLWKTPEVQSLRKRSSEFQVDDWAHYFLDEIKRIRKSDYVPTESDIIRCRVRTTGISEMRFRHNGLLFRVMDVGGQRTERRKWIHCFDDVTAVIFVVALSEFDQRLFEDETTWRMEESLTLFRSTFSNQHLQHIPFVIFFNKMDLFRAKLAAGKTPAITFPEYDGGTSPEAAMDFIKFKFLGARGTQDRDVFTHFTCADDTNQVGVVFEATQQIILRQNVSNQGLL